MKHASTTALLLVALMIAAQVHADTAEMTRVLVPIVPRGPVSGGYGSVWESTLSLTNRAGVPVRIVPYKYLGPLLILYPPLEEHPDTPPHVTFAPEMPPNHYGEGALLLIEADHAGDVALQLRVRDLSRQAFTHGTEVPVVREHEFLSTTSSLLAVPLDERFRSTLRIYDANPGIESHRVSIRVFGIDMERKVPFSAPLDQLLLEQMMVFTYSPAGREHYPGSIQIPDLSLLPELAGWEYVRVDIEPLDGDLRYWAFVSVTQKESQHVTLVTPQ